MTRLAIRTAALALALRCLTSAAAQVDRDNSPSRPPSAAREGVAHLTRVLQDSGWWAHLHNAGPWEQRPRRGLDAIEELCARYAWDSPADRFWIDGLRAVRALPPWDLPGRFDTLLHVLSERYALTDAQQQLLAELLVRRGAEVIARHAGGLLQIGLDARLTWAAGEAFTPEQVAQWSEQCGPILQDLRRQLDDGARELMQALDPSQRATLQTDLGVVHQRLDGVRELARVWAGGRWQAADWALADAQQPGVENGLAVGAGPGELGWPAAVTRPEGEPTSRPSAAEDEDVWATYVRDFIRRYRLDDAQQARAWSVYRDLKAQADQIRRRLDLSDQGSPTCESDEDGRRARRGVRPLTTQCASRLEGLFKQLRSRLERLPTRAQRRAVGGLPGAVAPPGSVCQEPRAGP